MPARHVIEVLDPPAPPPGFSAAGFRLLAGPGTGTPARPATARALEGALHAWVANGTLDYDLVAVARGPAGAERSCVWVSERRTWSDWV